MTETTLHILVIEDNIDDFELYQRTLANHSTISYRIRHAVSGQAGLEMIESSVPDCLLLDYSLPGLNGAQLLTRIRKTHPFLPVIVLTGQGNEAVAVQLLKMGAQNYINKRSATRERLHQLIADAIRDAAEMARSAGSSEPAELLIVDDSPEDRERCIRNLQQISVDAYRYTEATCGEEALAAIAVKPPDCVVLDYSMPGLNGLEVLTRILSAHPFLPVIMISGHGDEAVAVRAIKNGAYDYLVKSGITAADLYDSINAAIEHSTSRKSLAEKEKALNESEEKLRSVLEFQNLILKNMPDFVFVKDDKCRIVQGNPAFFNIYPPDMQESIIGTTTFEAYSEQDAEKFLEKDLQALAEGFSEAEEEVRFPDGRTHVLLTKKVRFNNENNETFILGVSRDITRLKEVEKALTESEERYHLAVEGLAVGVWDWNIKTDSLFWSERLKQLMGVSEKDFRPQLAEFIERLHPEDKERVTEQLSGHLENRTPYDTEYRLRHADGRYIWLHGRGQAIWDENGKPTRMAGSVEDITEKKVAQLQKERLIAKLVESNTELERFAYVASHDLQEPIRMVSSFTGLIDKKYAHMIDETGRKYLQLVRDSALRMQSLVDDLLVFSRIRETAEPNENVEVDKILFAVKENLASGIANSNAGITVGNMPEIAVNPIRLLRLFQNLIGNSLKYRDKNRLLHIEIDAQDRPGEWLFRVKDNGIGMRPEYCRKIFEPFTRLHGTGEYTGTGMGLTICRKIVEDFGGRIWAESEPGVGSVFNFTIPEIDYYEKDEIEEHDKQLC